MRDLLGMMKELGGLKAKMEAMQAERLPVQEREGL